MVVKSGFYLRGVQTDGAMAEQDLPHSFIFKRLIKKPKGDMEKIKLVS
jgi:hypothetical protein